VAVTGPAEGRAVTSPVAAVRHGLIVLSVIWQGLFILAELTSGRGGALSGWYLISITVSWLLLLSTTRSVRERRRWHGVAQAVNIAVLLVWSLVFFLALPSGGGWQEGASIVTIAVGLIGFLAATRTALIVVPVIAVAEFAVLVVGTRDLAAPPALSSDLLYGLYALTIGSVAALARSALLRAAGRAERSQEALMRERIQARAMQDVTDQLDADERRVHATVLNTLVAFGRGFIDDPAVITSRAQESVEVLRDLIPRERDATQPINLSWRAMLRKHTEDGRRAGLHIDMIEQVVHPVPEHVGNAFADVVGEAISNTIRHAQATQVSIALVEDGYGEFVLTLHDDGVGFADDHRPGFGIRQGMQGVMQGVGGTVAVSGEGGVRVEARWDGRQRPMQAAAAGAVGGILASFATPVLLLMWGLTTARLGFSVSEYADLRPVLFAYVWYSILVCIAIWLTRRGPLSPAWVVAIVIAAPVIYVFQAMGGVVAGATPWASWSSEAVASLFLVLIGAGPWWSALPVLGMWLVMQGDVIAEIFAPGFVILVATTFFARSMRRNAGVLDDSLAERVEIEATALAAREHAVRLADRYAYTRIGNAIGLLRSISTGQLDVTDPSVQAQCLREERLVRSVLVLNPTESEVDRLIGEFAQLAYATKRLLQVDIRHQPASVDSAALHAFDVAVRAVFRSSQASQEARLSDADEGGRYILQFVAASTWLPTSVEVRHDRVRIERVDDHTILVEGEVGDAASDH
jgi:hypothetical protein